MNARKRARIIRGEIVDVFVVKAGDCVIDSFVYWQPVQRHKAWSNVVAGLGS